MAGDSVQLEVEVGAGTGLLVLTQGESCVSLLRLDADRFEVSTTHRSRQGALLMACTRLDQGIQDTSLLVAAFRSYAHARRHHSTTNHHEYRSQCDHVPTPGAGDLLRSIAVLASADVQSGRVVESAFD